MSITPFDTQVRIIHELCKGQSIRGTEELTGVHRDTIMRLAVRVGEQCALVHDALVQKISANFVECDEIWTFVGKKEKRVDPNYDPHEYGDQYTFVAIDAETKLTINYLVGKRTPENTQKFIFDLRDRLATRVQISTDGWYSYQRAICDAFEGRVDHGVMQKTFESTAAANAPAAHRYSPGRVVAAERIMMTGNPIDERINTSYVERQNLTMRMSMARFERLTNAFSKKLQNLRAAVALHFAYVNFVRVHETLRVTPGMAANVTDHVWTIAELVSFAMSIPPIADPFGMDREVAA